MVRCGRDGSEHSNRSTEPSAQRAANTTSFQMTPEKAKRNGKKPASTAHDPIIRPLRRMQKIAKRQKESQ